MTVTLVTGGNKGLGRETAGQLVKEGYTVYIGARSAERGQSAAVEIGARFVQLDVTDDASVGRALELIGQHEGHLDVLVNNAGVGLPALSGPEALQVFDTNVVGIIRVTQAALPLLRKSANPVVVNVTSILGSLRAVSAPGSPLAHVPAIVYGSSKAAASMLTLQYAHAIPDVKFNAVDPGATATDMTAGRGGRPVEQSAQVIVRLATIGPDGPTGTFQLDSGAQPW
jgi:NAD(P)-dependent dehydrogenase (short-subunit alcohol dehydrogenase family)